MSAMSATLQPKAAQTSGNLSSGGSGKFKPLRKTAKVSKPASEFNPFEPKYDRMAFKTAKDPVYMAFDYLEKQSLSKIASDFVKENITYPINKFFGQIASAI